jgi:hypothetical protein
MEGECKMNMNITESVSLRELMEAFKAEVDKMMATQGSVELHGVKMLDGWSMKITIAAPGILDREEDE